MPRMMTNHVRRMTTWRLCRKCIGLTLDFDLHLIGDGNGAFTGEVEFTLDVVANESGGPGVVVDKSRGSNRFGVGDGFVEEVSGSANLGRIGGAQTGGFCNRGIVVSIGGVEFAVDDMHLVEVGFDNDLVEVEAVTYVERTCAVHLMDSMKLAIDELRVPIINDANFDGNI